MFEFGHLDGIKGDENVRIPTPAFDATLSCGLHKLSLAINYSLLGCNHSTYSRSVMLFLPASCPCPALLVGGIWGRLERQTIWMLSFYNVTNKIFGRNMGPLILVLTGLLHNLIKYPLEQYHWNFLERIQVCQQGILPFLLQLAAWLTLHTQNVHFEFLRSICENCSVPAGSWFPFETAQKQTGRPNQRPG